MEGDYYEKRAKIPIEKREKWAKEQAYIRNKIIMQDDFKWKVEELELVAGVDISFSGKFQNGACAGLVIYSLKTKKIIYQDSLYVVLKEEYVPGFLAFKELAPTLELFKRLKAKRPQLWPQVILVDGNGILHKFQCGYASHLGVLLDVPTIGCAKTFFDVDGLHQNEVEDWLKDQLRFHGESIVVKGKSGKQWCKAMLVDQNQEKFVYISIGTKISLSTATQVVLKLVVRDGPEPIRVVDGFTRRMIRKMQEEDYKKAPSFDMIYLSK